MIDKFRILLIGAGMACAGCVALLLVMKFECEVEHNMNFCKLTFVPVEIEKE